MFKSTLITTYLFFSSVAFAWPQTGEDCNYPCLSVPPLSESYIEFGRAEETILPSQNLNLLVWNLYKGKKETFDSDFKRMSQNKNILILQEVLLNDKITTTFNSLNGYIFSDAVSFIHKSSFPSGVATASKAMYTTKQILRTIDREPIIDTPKTIMITTYTLDDGQELLVINIHGINVTGTDALERQLKQTEKMIKAHIGPVIFAGDFNTHLEERKVITNNFFTNLNMSHAILKNDSRKSNKIFDHIYYRNLVINNAELVSHLTGSDHPAIIATVSTH